VTYRPAAICKRGHVISGAITPSAEIQSHCHRCGASVLTACENCGHRLRGRAQNVGGNLKVPEFCDSCGAPHPWLSREGRIYLLENLLDEEGLDPATELEVREQLKALMDSSLSTEDQQRRWEKVKRLAPGFWDKSGARTILETVVSAGIKAALGL